MTDEEPEIQQAYIPSVPVCWPGLNREERLGHLEVLEHWLD